MDGGGTRVAGSGGGGRARDDGSQRGAQKNADMESPDGGGGLGLLLNAAVMRAKPPLNREVVDWGAGVGAGELTELEGPPGLKGCICC